jgi:aspartyl-tRNA(Asn)/glutamyl-tRNA(Gln) amidotransferase subunit A
MKSIILDLHQKLITKKITIVDLVNDYKNAYERNIKNNDTITPTYSQALQHASELQSNIDKHNADLLYGIPYSLKDNISTSNIKTTGGSLFLKDYIPPFSATVYESLQSANAVLLNKANCDEFGMGGTGLSSAYGQVHNIHDFNRTTGGSSSGGANQVASDIVPFTISTDTGDSIRRPASFVGVVGYKPTSGLISRYGVFPYAPSLDCVGINAKTVSDCAIVAQYIVKHDDKDYTSEHINKADFFNELKTLKNIKINVIKDIHKYLESDLIDPYNNALQVLKSHGCDIKEVDISHDILSVILPTYMTISYSEGSSCYANLTGINFGLNNGGKTYEETILKNRTQGIGKEVIRRLLIGEVLTNKDNFNDIFLRAKRAHTLLMNTYNELLADADCLLLPGASSIAPLIEDVINKKSKTTFADDLLILANFARVPSITIPYTKVNRMPFGLNINCKAFEDQKTLDIAYSIENIFETCGEKNG